ncbi:hypothetical protein AgCh_010315 [Apium graveolens]
MPLQRILQTTIGMLQKYELCIYDPDYLERPSIVVLNKIHILKYVSHLLFLNKIGVNMDPLAPVFAGCI